MHYVTSIIRFSLLRKIAESLTLESLEKTNKIGIRFVLSTYSLCLVIGIIFCSGTGDMGDSITHFLFAKYAPKHPELYFHHWAKPVFVLLASPFAQLGFSGLKFFNATIALVNVYLCYRVALKLNIKHAWMAALLLACMPLNYILSLSALTEPLFALFTVLALYWTVSKKYIAAALLLSFLPYVRSEGLIIIGVFALYFIQLRTYKSVVCLLAGSIAYGIAGYTVHGDVLWVFTKIPYAHLSSVYGKGTWHHFVEQLTNVVGIPIYIFLWIGVLYCLTKLLSRNFSNEKHLLLLLLFLCFFIAHSLFWYLGIFNSMGLIRVFLGIAPIMALLALQGYNSIEERLSVRYSKYLAAPVILYVVLFPFTPNPSAIQFKKDLMATPEQRLADKIATYTKQLRSNNLPVVYNHYYLSLAMQNDIFSRQERIPLNSTELYKLPKGSVIIWDSVLFGWECDIDKTKLDAEQSLIPILTFSTDNFGKQIVFAVYVKR